MFRILCLLAAGTILISCSMFQRFSSQAANIIPRETDVPGWTKSDTVKIKRDDIAGYRAVYGGYDPVEIAIATYRPLSDPDVSICIEVIRFSRDIDSFGLFSLEKSSGGILEGEGDIVFKTLTGLFMRRGRYYVRVTAGEPNKAVESGMSLFRESLQGNLRRYADPGSLPEAISLFPGDSFSRNLVYCKKGHEKVPGLADFFIEQGVFQGSAGRIFYAKRSTPYDAEREFQGILESAGDAYMLSKVGDQQVAIRIIDRASHVYMAVYEEWIFGVFAESLQEGNLFILRLYDTIRAYETGHEKKRK